MTGSFHIVSLQNNSVAIGAEGTPNTASIDRVTHAQLLTDRKQHETTMAEPETTENSGLSEARDNNEDKYKYVAERVDRHVGNGGTLRVVVR